MVGAAGAEAAAAPGALVAPAAAGAARAPADPTTAEKLRNLPTMIGLVTSQEPQSQYEGTVQFRKLLSIGACRQRGVVMLFSPFFVSMFVLTPRTAPLILSPSCRAQPSHR